METNNTQPTTGQPPLPTGELWRALLVVFNHYLSLELAAYRLCPEDEQPPQPVIEAIQLLDVWLDFAIEDGWLKDTQPVS